MIRRLRTGVKELWAGRIQRAHRAALEATGFYHNERLSPELWDCAVNQAGELTADGVSLSEVAERFGTPLHVVHAGRLRANYQRFVGSFAGASARVRLGTSYKTNPVPFVLQTLHECGTLAEVISHFELWLALELGVPGSRIIFNGPGKSRESLELAVDNDVWMINVDSMEELEDLREICRARGRRQTIGLRLTAGVGWESQFGFPIGDGSALEGFRAAVDSESLDPVGLHLHLGTGITNTRIYVEGISASLRFAAEMKKRLGITLHVLDFGGGFGVPTTRSRGSWDRRLEQSGRPIRAAVPGSAPTPDDYARVIVPLVDRYFDEVGAEERELIFEPGRAITASAQMLLLSVLRIKEHGRGTPDVILDGGRNLCMPLAWEFHEIHPVGKMRDASLRPQNLYGPLCHPHDVVALHKPLPKLEPGDVVGVMDAGAYFVPNQMNFSNPRPGVVAIDQGVARQVRSPESFADIVRLDAIGQALGAGR